MLWGGSEEVCPSEDVFVQMLQGGLDAQERQRLDAHLDRCPICSQLVLELADLISHYSEERSLLVRDDASSKDARREAPAPIFLDGYRLEEMIGAGGMGVVYRARDLTLERDVAIKVIRADLLARAGAQGSEQPGKRLLQEARMLARVEHPHVVSIYAASFAGEHLYIVMELVEGETLDGYIRHHALTHEAILDLYIQVGLGLEAAHARGVIHRDVKPSNILVNASGDALLTDFGLARAVIERERSGEGVGEQSSLTRRGVVLGTPAFMPPEQHLGGVADERSDVFACCASLFWSIFGVRPFEGSTIEEVALNACAGEVREVPLETRAMRVLHATLVKGMARKKEARHASMAELVEELRAARALCVTSGARSGKVGSNSKSAIAIALLLLILLVAGSVVVWWREASSTAPERETPTPSEEIVGEPEWLAEHVQRHQPPVPVITALPVRDAVMTAVNEVESARAFGEEHLSKRKSSTATGGVAPKTGPVPVRQKPERKAIEARATEGAAAVLAGAQAKEGRRKLEAQAKVTRALQRLDAKACHAALDGLPPQDTFVQLLEGQCLLLAGKCEASDALFREAYEKISPGMNISGLLKLNRKMCKPSKEEPEALLAWQSGVLFYEEQDMALCKKTARRIVKLLDEGSLEARLQANEEARLTLRNNLGYGLKCLARSKDPAELCDVVEKMVYHEAKLTGYEPDGNVMRAVAKKVPEFTVCVE